MYIGNITQYITHHKIEKAVVYKDEHLHVMMLNLPKGEELKPHSSPVDAFFVVQCGEVEFTLEGELFHLKQGDVFHFKAGQVHALKATSNFSMLIVK